MKKYIALILAIALTFAVFAVAASASETIKAEVKYFPERNVLLVEGLIENNRDRIPMTLRIVKDGKTVGAAETLATGFDADGVVRFRFPEIALNNATTSGTMSISIAADFINAQKEQTFEYIGVDRQLAVMQSLSGLIAAKNVSEFMNAVLLNEEALGIEVASYTKLSSKASLKAQKLLISQSYVLPEDYSTDEKILMIKKAVQEFYELYDESIALGNFFDLKSPAALMTWYNDYKLAYGLNGDVAVTAEDESKMVSYFETAMQTEKIIQRITFLTDTDNMNELNTEMKKQAMLCKVESSNYHTVRTIMESFPTLFSIDFDDFNDLSSAKQGEIYQAVSGRCFDSFKSLSDAINQAIEDASGSGSGGDRGKSKDSEQMIISSELTKYAISKIPTFADLGTVTWAESAIRYLYGKGVVTGRDVNTFAPNDRVTRAELVKMIVFAFDFQLTEGAQSSFSDVSPEAWYAQAVAAAEQNGIIQGDEQGHFRSDETVTREDVAVMLYRSLKNRNRAAESSEFKDRTAISDYAIDAVDFLYENGAINGLGDGKFGPRENTTRAQVAKMLYVLLTSVVK